jgi:hypothetical protein
MVWRRPLFLLSSKALFLSMRASLLLLGTPGRFVLSTWRARQSYAGLHVDSMPRHSLTQGRRLLARTPDCCSLLPCLQQKDASFVAGRQVQTLLHCAHGVQEVARPQLAHVMGSGSSVQKTQNKTTLDNLFSRCRRVPCRGIRPDTGQPPCAILPRICFRRPELLPDGSGGYCCGLGSPPSRLQPLSAEGCSLVLRHPSCVAVVLWLNAFFLSLQCAPVASSILGGDFLLFFARNAASD